MFRALTIIAAIAALAVTAAPASAGSLKKPSPRTTQVVVLIGANEYGLMETDGDKLFYVDETGILRQRGKAKVPRLTGTQDGTSNTMMKSGSLKPSRNGIIAILIG